jgi:hypothetical protein
MRTKLFIGSASAVVLVIAAVAFAGAITKPQPTITQAQGYICPVTGEELPCPLCCPYKAQAAQQSSQTQPCCTEQDCCPECLACCAEDGCCEECILWCLAMGCDPLCCFPSPAGASAQAPGPAEACCTTPAPTKGQDCCADGCCK